MKDKKSICIIGQLPPPVHGLSTALQTIIDNQYLNKEYSINTIDIKENKRIINHVKNIIKNNSDLYYFTISQSIFGNLRDMLILAILLKKKKKVILHYHGGYYKHLYEKMNKFQRYINRRLISKIHIMIALGDSLKSIFDDVISPEKIRVCENYIEESSLTDDLSFNQKLDQLKSNSTLEVLYLSNFIKSKGYMDVLKSAKVLRNENIRFHFAGAFFTKVEKHEFLQLIKEWNLEETVYYHGIVKGEKKKELLTKSHVFALPTYYPYEGQPISIIEAMGNGLTVITTNHAGIKDIVNNENGYFVNSQSPLQITDCLRTLSSQTQKIRFYAFNNRKSVLNRFKEKDYINRLEKIFNEVLYK
ncbi:glycosyltransferase [Bacillus sp. 1780r2a1]|nr:glycosyltransferase [Bacillus sp. 1780r2a1]